MTTATRTSRQERRQAAIDKQLALTAASIDQLRNSDGWKQWLDTRKRFHRYSFANQLLIALQRPDSTLVSGFRTWINLGYAVRKGEHGIKIWAPVTPSKAKMQAWEAAGKPAGEKPDTYFRLVTVFDRAQVDPIPDQEQTPLAPDWPELTTDLLAAYLPRLEQLAADNHAPVTYHPQPDINGARGRLNLKNGTPDSIQLADHMSKDETVATLIHELGHALIRTQKDTIHPPPQLNQRHEELIVESTTYAVCNTLGLDTSDMTIPYLATWASDSPADDLQTHARTIHNLANHIETALSNA